MSSWRAGCGESRTSGSEGGPRKRTDCKVGTAPRPDPYTEYTRALRTASRAAKGEKAPADAAPAKAKPARLKPETKGEKAMRVPIVRSGSDAEAQATLRGRVRAAGGSLPANAEAEPPTPRNGRRSKARDADVDTAVSEDIGGLESQAAEEIAREPETLGVNRGEFASE